MHLIKKIFREDALDKRKVQIEFRWRRKYGILVRYEE